MKEGLAPELLKRAQWRTVACTSLWLAQLATVLFLVMTAAHLKDVYGREYSQLLSKQHNGLSQWAKCQQTQLDVDERFGPHCRQAKADAESHPRTAAVAAAIAHFFKDDVLYVGTFGCSASPWCQTLLYKFADTLVSLSSWLLTLGILLAGYMLVTALFGPYAAYRNMQKAWYLNAYGPGGDVHMTNMEGYVHTKLQ